MNRFHLLLSAAMLVPAWLGCNSAEPQPPAEPTPVAVYCFHGNETCEYCEKIEQWSHEALQEQFADELDSGRVTWEVINFEAPGNEHFADRYDIITSCIVIDPAPHDAEGDDWVNLQQQVWQHATADDPEALRKLVAEELRARLGG
jgi:hypothetical protein